MIDNELSKFYIYYIHTLLNSVLPNSTLLQVRENKPTIFTLLTFIIVDVIKEKEKKNHSTYQTQIPWGKRQQIYGGDQFMVCVPILNIIFTKTYKRC